MREYQRRWEKGQAVLYKIFRSYVPVTYEVRAIVSKIEQRKLKRIKALDIGAGEGSVALEIIDSLKKAGAEVASWEAMDVSKEQLIQFQARVSGVVKPEFRLHLQGWNEFNLEGQYDFVLARHSWYGMSKWKEESRETNSLFKLHRAVKKQGLGLIVLSPKDNILFSVPNPFQGDTASEDVCRALVGIGLEFYCQKVRRPIAALLEGGKLTEAGYGIFQYMLHTQEISEEKRTEIEHCLSKWFRKHKEWVSESELIWIEK